MVENSQDFVMSFDPKTIEHLGIRMYSTLPPVITELIANSYDADAENVWITLLDSNEKKEIIVEDDGIGMTFTELNDKFLRIGRNRRDEEGVQKTPKERKIIGKKGIGKLSFFGVAHEVEISTKKNGKQNSFVMNWEDIKNSTESEYNPKPIFKDKKYSGKDHGTRIVLKELKRESVFDPDSLADSISKNFIVDSGFKIIIKHNSEEPITIDNERKYNGINKQVEWNIPGDIDNSDSGYENKNQVIGHLIATEFPIPPKTNMKGITLFSRKKLVNNPEYFSDSTSSHIFSYLTGWLEVDFIDDLEEDVISTNRQSLNWDHPEMAKLREYLSKLINKIEQDWRIKREKVREKKLSESTGIDISDWVSKLPQEIKDKVGPLIKDVLKNVEPTEETKNVNNKIIETMHSIAPEYTYWHYRHLHPNVKTWAEEDYKRGDDYYVAAEKASRAYIRGVKDKAGVDARQEDTNMEQAFNVGTGKLLVNNCASVIEQTIQNGQCHLSKGIVAGCRNPLDHSFPDYQERLGNTGLFTEQDCLDMLSLISHLQRRLDNSRLREETTTNNNSAPVE